MSVWNHDADPTDYLPINERVQLFKVCNSRNSVQCPNRALFEDMLYKLTMKEQATLRSQ